MATKSKRIEWESEPDPALSELALDAAATSSESAEDPGAAASGETGGVDGRTARRRRTRQSIVDACIQLINKGDLRPTAPRIAEQAGTSVRSVFQHFEDLESLFTMVADTTIREAVKKVRPIDLTLPPEQRIGQFVQRRGDHLESISPLRRSAAVNAPFSPGISARVELGHQLFKIELERIFGTEIGALAEPDLIYLSLGVALSWPSWETLRSLDRLSVEEAKEVFETTIKVALGIV